MLDYGPDGKKYTYQGSFPSKSEYTVYHVYKGGKTVLSCGYGVSSDIVSDIVDFLIKSKITGFTKTSTLTKLITVLRDHRFLVESVVSPHYNTALLSIKEKDKALQDAWYNDIYEHYSLPLDASETQLLMGVAWERGHSSGLHSVEGELLELLGFVEDLDKARKMDVPKIKTKRAA